MVVSPNLLCSGNSCDSKGLRSLDRVFLLTFVILVQTPRFTSNSTLTIKLLTSHQTPRSTPNSSYNIKLLTSHQTPRFTSNSTQHPSSSLQRYTIKRRPQPTSTVWTRPPRDGWRRGESSRQELPRKPSRGALSARVPAKTADND